MSLTINSLSKELLLLIFKNLTSFEQKQCQFVCRSWYYPAHLCVLAEINLEYLFEVKRFIRSIDYNPDPSYLRAVKKISIGASLHAEFVPTIEFSKERIKKLFLRFPNLERVYLQDCSIWFDTEFEKKEFCEELLKSCRKLDTFEVDIENQPNYCGSMYKFRYITTKLAIKWSDEDCVESYGGLVNYATMFPRLTSLHQNIINFQSLLPAFDKLEKLNSINVLLNEEDGDNHVDQYLRTKSDSDKSKILKRLSNVKRLDMSYHDRIRANSIRLINKYFTGLEKFDLTSRWNMDWTKADEDLFYGELSNLVLSAKNETCIGFDEMSSEILTRCFTNIMDKMFRQLPFLPSNKTNRVLDLHTFGGPRDDVVSLALGKDKERDRYIEVYAHKELHKCLFENTTYDVVDELKLIIEERSKFGYLNMYTILQPFPSVKKLVLDIPESYNEHQDKYEGKPFPRVKDVTIQATPDGQYQTLLQIYSSMFPNIDRLAIHYFCGVWLEDIGGFQLMLTQYSLKRLTIDISQVVLKMLKHSKKRPTDLDILVIDIEVLKDCKHYYYMAPLNLSSITRIKSTDLKGSAPNEDYLQVRVCIKNLRYLELCFCDSNTKTIWFRIGSSLHT